MENIELAYHYQELSLKYMDLGLIGDSIYYHLKALELLKPFKITI